MPYTFDHSQICPACPYGNCIEDRRNNPVRGRDTKFRFKQDVAEACTFDAFVPGTDNDPEPERSFDALLNQFRQNVLSAGGVLFPNAVEFKTSALAKVEGDVFERIEAAALWNAAAVWNRFMDTGVWSSTAFTQPVSAVATPSRKILILKLPRNYDPTLLFEPKVRSGILAHEAALNAHGMEIGLSSPDIVGVRLPEHVPSQLAPLMSDLPNLGLAATIQLERAHKLVEGTLPARAFLFAIAIKRTTRSDRLYQALFEANVLKYLIEHVLNGAAFKFYVHMGSLEGADVEGRYRAASLISLMRGGMPAKAVDAVLQVNGPQQAAQAILNDLPTFPL